MAKQAIFALDLGTTKFCIAALYKEKDRKQFRIVEVPSAGMRRGMLADFPEAQKALNELLEKAEKELNCDIRQIVVGIAGSHLRGHMTEKSINIENDLISQNHIEKLSKQVEESEVNPYRELLHCIPFHFQIDGREPVKNPVGLSGIKLTGRYYCIDADKSYLKDVVRLCNTVGLEVLQLFSEPFASASVTISDKLKQSGVALADIGGGTTDGIVFQNGKPASVFTINIAGRMMTNDLAMALNLDNPTAEKLKHDIGLLRSGGSIQKAENIHGTQINIPSKYINQILEARILELASYIVESLKNYKGRLGGGLVLTGGGSEIECITNFLTEKFGIPVTHTNPVLNHLNQTYDNYPGRYATVIGLVNLEICRRHSHHNLKPHLWARRYINQFVNWVKDIS